MREKPDVIIPDNRKEFCNPEHEIKHPNLVIQSHTTNGWVHPVIGSIREALVKDNLIHLTKNVKRITDPYNESYHSRIKSTPKDPCYHNTGLVIIENRPQDSYSNIFKKDFRDQFKNPI